jgi:hypothetical protein
MKVLAVIAAVTVASAAAFGAAAQPAPTPSPEKVELAKKMVALSGGADQMNALMQTMFKSRGGLMGANLPPEQKKMQAVIMEKMQARFTALTPKLIDATVNVYAANLSEKELQDYVAWMQSDTAEAIKQKTPTIMAQSLQLMMPVIAEVTQGMKEDVVEQVCKEAHCSAKDREVITAAMAKAMSKQPS